MKHRSGRPAATRSRTQQRLRSRLAEAEEALRAIRSGEVDALVVSGPRGEQVFTLKGADHSYRILIEELNEGALILTPEGVIFYANRRLAELLRMPLDRLISSPLLERVAPGDRARCQEILLRGGPGPRQAELELLADDGVKVPVKLSASPLQDDGKPPSLGIVLSDLTAQKEAAAAILRLNAGLERRVAERTADLEAANRELEAFSYSVSHDLRAPLRAIDGFSQALEEDYGDRIDAPGREAIRHVRASTQRMSALIDDLLNLSRIASVPLRLASVDLAPIAGEIAAQLRAEQPGRQVTFRIAARAMVEGDPGLLRIVLDNLLRNAWKFTARRARATIEFDRVLRDGIATYLVRDDGAGFDMAFAGRLFAPFQRMHAASAFEGTGIGLATVQRIIHRHGGTVWAEAEQDRGATFFFRLEAAPRERGEG